MLLFASGCIQGTIQRQVAVYRDSEGNITQIVETESFTHAATTSKQLHFDTLRYGGSNKETVKVSAQ